MRSICTFISLRRFLSIRRFLVAMLTLLLIAGCSPGPDSSNPHAPESSPSPEPDLVEASPSPQPEATPTPYTVEAKLVAVGDIMMHQRQITSGYNAEEKSYDFRSFFSEVKPILSKGDWIWCNLETTLSGEDLRGYTGYPEFNAPDALADALEYAGFNIVTNANNHSLDRREQGVIRTLEKLHRHPFVTKGTAASADEADQVKIAVKNGISLAVLAYTYGTNGIPIPDGKDYLVSLIDPAKMLEDIRAAREKGADLVAIALHFGDEYHLEPNDYQKELVRQLIAGGADIILGSHPHVVQPYEFVTVAEPNGGATRKGLVIYSLGNFISDQDRFHTPFKPTDTGVIMDIDIQKHFPEEVTEIKDVHFYPTYVQRYRQDGRLQFRVLPLEAVLSGERDDPLLTDKDYKQYDQFLKEMNAHLHSMTVPVSNSQP